MRRFDGVNRKLGEKKPRAREKEKDAKWRSKSLRPRFILARGRTRGATNRLFVEKVTDPRLLVSPCDADIVQFIDPPSRLSRDNAIQLYTSVYPVERDKKRKMIRK